MEANRWDIEEVTDSDGKTWWIRDFAYPRPSSMGISGPYKSRRKATNLIKKWQANLDGIEKEG